MVRQTNRLITPTEATQVTQAVTKLQPASALKFTQKTAPTVSFNKQRLIREQYKNNKEVQTFLSDYNDPTELNSYIDALTNRAAVSEKFGDTWGTISTITGTAAIVAAALAPFTGGASLPVAAVLTIPSIPAAVDVTVEKGIKPILAGKPKEALLNGVMNYGETLDAIANPIKGLILDGPEGFFKGTGLSNEGRVNYDYDTGNIITDVAAEILSDPTNWFTWGVKAISTKGAKVAVKESATNLVTEVIEIVNTQFAKVLGEVSIEGKEFLIQKMTKAYARVAQDWSLASFKKLTKYELQLLQIQGQEYLQNQLIRGLKKALPKSSATKLQLILDNVKSKSAKNIKLRKAIQQTSNITFDSLAVNSIKGIASMLHYSDVAQRALTSGAILTSGYGLGVEAARSGWKNLKAWGAHHTIQSLKKAGKFNDITGIDLFQYDDAKILWEAKYQYTTELTNEAMQRNMHTFHSAVAHQLNRDQQLINIILQGSESPIKKANKITKQIKELYPDATSFKNYIEILDNINQIEHNVYQDYVSYIKNVYATLQGNAYTTVTGNKITTGKALYSKIVEPKDIVQQISQAIKDNKGSFKTTDRLYSLKLNNIHVNETLLNDSIIYNTLIETQSAERLGALLDHILEDINSRMPTANSTILDAAQIIKRTSASLINVQNLYNDIANIPLPAKLGDIPADSFRHYILDEIFYGEYTSPTTLLAAFDSNTIPSLKVRISELCANNGFVFDNAVIEQSIYGAYKRFLEAQNKAGVPYHWALIPDNFSSKVEDLITNLPEYADALENLRLADIQIKTILKTTKETNSALAELFTDYNTIFNVLGLTTHQLTDAGLALDTVANANNISRFNFPSTEISGALMREANRIGKEIRELHAGLNQYYLEPNPKTIRALQDVYEKVSKIFSNTFEYPDLEIFTYLKPTSELDPFEQLARLAIFNKFPKSDTANKIFKSILYDNLSTKDIYDILHPEHLLHTTFAWDAMGQSKWIVKKQLSNETKNLINAYRNVERNSKKITNDLISLRRLLSENKIDRPKVYQLERYIKAATPINEMLEYTQKMNDRLFDKELAKTKIEAAREFLLNDRHAQEKYSKLIDTLEKYWHGEIDFDQLNVFDINFDPEKDPFTLFWNAIKSFNKDYVYWQEAQITKENVIQAFELVPAAQTPSEIVMDNFIKVLQTPNKDFTEEVWQDYVYVLKTLLNTRRISEDLLDTYGGKRIPYNLLPAHTRDISFKYYYDILGIDDPNLAVQFLESRRGLMGYHTPGKSDITASITSLVDNYTEILSVLEHEAAHSVIDNAFNVTKLDNLFDIYDYQKYLKDSYKLLSDKLGVDFAAEYLVNLVEIYQRSYGIPGKVLNSLNALTATKNYDKILEVFEELDPEHVYAMLDEIHSNMYSGEIINRVLRYQKEYQASLDGVRELYYDPRNSLINADLLSLEQPTRELRDSLHTSLLDLAERNGNANKLRQSYEDWLKTKKPVAIGTSAKDYITPWDPCRKQQEFNKLIRQATELNARGSLYNVCSFTPEQLVNELAYRHRIILFTTDDIAEDSSLNKLFKRFKTTIPTEQVQLQQVDNVIWIYLKPEQIVEMSGRQAILNGVPILRKLRPKTFEEFKIVDKYVGNDRITKTLNKLDASMQELTGSNLGDSQAEFMTKDTLFKIYEQMPEQVKENFFSDKFTFEDWTNIQYFGTYHFNESILGSAKSKANLGLKSSNMISNASTAITQAQAYVKAKNEYVNTVCDSMLSISSENSIYRNFTDQDLLEALQATPDYHLITNAIDKMGLKVRTITPLKVEDITKAREVGAWIVPTQIAKDMYNTVNHRLGSSGFAQLWSRIMYMYKFGYLCRPGAWIRNWIDTNLKSRIEMGEDYGYYNKKAHAILDDVDLLKDYIKDTDKQLIKQAQLKYGDLAKKLYTEKASIDEFIQRRAYDGFIREDAIKQWFIDNADKMKILDYESYKELNNAFLDTAISGNIMSELYNTPGGDLWNTFTSLTGRIIDVHNVTENYNRLAMYLYELDKGADYTSALAKIAKTHFDYSFKTKTEQLVDMIFPFTTFSMRNYSYWIETIEKHPELLRNYVHLMKPSWDFKDYTPEELAVNKRVQTQILYGQLKLGEFNDKVLLFKLNPSVQDAIQMFSDPINNVYEKLAAPIAVPLQLAKGEYTNPTNLIPVIGPAIQSTQTMIKQGNPAPSVIGVANKPIKFSNPNLSGTDKYTDNTYRTPKYRNNIVYDSYSVKGVKQYRVNLYPIVDVFHDIQMRYSTNVYGRIKNRINKNVFNGIRYRIKLDVNKFR